MASPGCRAWRRCSHCHTNHHHHHHHRHYHCLHHLHHHHHHHHNYYCCHFIPTCARHNHLLHCPFQGNLNFSHPLLQKPESFVPFPIRDNSNVETVEYKEVDGPATQISQELEHMELDEEEDDDEPIFVLTDEWRDFFAKSEARRRLEKQSTKGKKKK